VYRKILSTFWTGDTGKQIRAAGKPTQITALYLMTCPSSRMTGLYYLPLTYLRHETGLGIAEAQEAMEVLQGIGFCKYDKEHEVVFVTEMACHQVGPDLKPADLRIKGIKKEIQQHNKSSLHRDFLRRYEKAFSLNGASPSEAPRKGLGRGSEAPSKPVTGSGAVAGSGTGTKPKACATCLKILSELNRLKGSSYRGEGKTLEMIHARHQTYGLDECLMVIRHRHQSAKTSTDRKFFRPSTLFRPGYFEDTLQDARGALGHQTREDAELDF